MATKIEKVNKTNVVSVIKELKSLPNMECGVDEIEFPDGTKEKFHYNGEADRQAAIQFATICVNATSNTNEAKKLMATCYNLMIKGINPTKIVKIANIEFYLDSKKKGIYDSTGRTVVELDDSEKKIKMSDEALTILLTEKVKNKVLSDINRVSIKVSVD